MAGELHLPLFQVRLDGLISKFMGETAVKLRLIFDSVRATRAVYFSMSSMPLRRSVAWVTMWERSAEF